MELAKKKLLWTYSDNVIKRIYFLFASIFISIHDVENFNLHHYKLYFFLGIRKNIADGRFIHGKILLYSKELTFSCQTVFHFDYFKSILVSFKHNNSRTFSKLLSFFLFYFIA
jgi:hypothetical protein